VKEEEERKKERKKERKGKERERGLRPLGGPVTLKGLSHTMSESVTRVA
jgi:hypothetical protein